MADELDIGGATTTRKTIGTVPVAKLAKEKVFKDWQEASRNFGMMKIKVSEQKELVKAMLKKKSKALQDRDFDFIVQNDSLQVFEKVGKTARRRSKELELE